MASKRETADALRRVAAIFHTMTVTEEMANAWHDILQDADPAALATATGNVLSSWTNTFPPGPGAINLAARNLARAESERHGVSTIPSRGSIPQAQQTAALRANVTAAISLDGKTREAGRTGAVYARIRRQAAERGYADLPEWTP